MLCFVFLPAFAYKIYSLKLYHLLDFTLHSKANACNISTFIRFYCICNSYPNAGGKKTKHLPIDSTGHSHNSVICSVNAKMDNSVTLIDKVFVFSFFLLGKNYLSCKRTWCEPNLDEILLTPKELNEKKCTGMANPPSLLPSCPL